MGVFHNPKPEIVLVGGGSHCESLIEVIESGNRYKIKGVIENEKKEVLGVPVLGNDTIIGTIPSNTFFIIAVGQITSSSIRRRLYDMLKKAERKITVVMAGTAVLSKLAVVGEGTSLHHHTVVNAGSTIGVCNIINTGAIIEHGCVLGDFNHVSTGVIINGNCVIGNDVFIGSGTIVRNGISICSNVIVGAGSYVSSNIERPGVYIGMPARLVRE